MQRSFLHSAMVLLVVAMLGGHVTELFDHWDHTLRTGRDADYTVVVIAASIGVGLVAIKKVAAVLLSSSSDRPEATELHFSVQALPSEAPVAGPSPPLLLPIRI